MKFDLDLDPDLAEMSAAVADFARDKLGAADGFEPEDFRRRWRLAAGQGLAATTIPTHYGGGGLDATAAAAVLEALGYGCPDLGFVFSLAAHQFACLTAVAHFGTEAQRERWLPPLCSGEQIAAHAITEPNAGSDALNLSLRARYEGSHYVLSGIKSFTTNAPVADVFVIQAATSPDAGFFGLSSFLVEAGTPGLNVGRPHGKLGLRGSPTAEVYLDECAVPAEQMLGGKGAGASVFSDSMAWERTCLFAAYLGGMRRILESTIAYAREREQFGAPIGHHQAVSHRIVDMTLRYESARLLLYRAAEGLDRGSREEIAPALAKLAVSESAVQLGLDAVQLRGALGVLDGEAEQFLRDALPSRIFSGTNEIQKNNIARALGLGAPRPVRRGRP